MSDTIPQNPPQKQCSACKQHKPATNEFFSLNKYTHDGFKYQCKECINTTEFKKRAEKRAAKAPPPGHKRCSVCKAIKPATLQHFAKLWRSSDKLRGVCKDCQKAYDATRAEIKTERRRQKKQQDFAYNQHRKERQRQYDEQRYLTQGPELLERKKAWYAAHPEQRRVEAHRRRAREREVGGNHTAQDEIDQFKRQKGKCYYCRKKLDKKFHVDHIVPITRGGTNDKSNLVVTCQTCNLKKHDRLPHEWPEGGRLF